MLKYGILLLCALATEVVSAQDAKDLQFGAGMDALKSDFVDPIEKIQLGLELNYFLVKGISLSGGLEMWTGSINSAALGTRLYPARNVFVRGRGLIGVDDFCFGLGFVKNLDKAVMLEFIGDYFLEGEFAIRAGITFTP